MATFYVSDHREMVEQRFRDEALDIGDSVVLLEGFRQMLVIGHACARADAQFAWADFGQCVAVFRVDVILHQI